MQKEVNGMEAENNRKKNEINQYLEAYIKCKDTMRSNNPNPIKK